MAPLGERIKTLRRGTVLLSSSLEFPQGRRLLLQQPDALGHLPPVPGGQEAAVPETLATVGVSWLVLGSEGSFQKVGCLGRCMLKSMASDRTRNGLNRGQMLHGNVLLQISMSPQYQAGQR